MGISNEIQVKVIKAQLCSWQGWMTLLDMSCLKAKLNTKGMEAVRFARLINIRHGFFQKQK